ncbi:MAG TPA: chorismate mutase [Bryobacterales bacterium]|nr:chorismate mutase [Bryobacterales bacterium]
MDMSDWRDKIDGVDCRIVELLNERARYVLALAPLKKRAGMPIYEPTREQHVFENIARHNGGPLAPDAVRRIYERVIDEMRSIQREPMEKEKK